MIRTSNTGDLLKSMAVRYRTTASLSYTPQAICISCFYATALLHSPPPNTPAPGEREGTDLPSADVEMEEDMSACRKDVFDWQRKSRATWLEDLSVSFDDVHGELNVSILLPIVPNDFLSSRYRSSATGLARFPASIRKPSGSHLNRTFSHAVLWHTSLAV